MPKKKGKKAIERPTGDPFCSRCGWEGSGDKCSKCGGEMVAPK